MDYTSLAQELLTVRAKLLQVPANQQLSQMVRGEMFVLNYLFTHEGAIHPKELSRQMAVTTARIASLLNHMEQKQLLLRRADPDDNRQVIVKLTEQGRAIAGEGCAAQQRFFSALYAGVTEAEFALWRGITQKVCGNLENLEKTE